MLEVIKHHFVGGADDKTEVYLKEMSIGDEFEVVSHKHKFNHVSLLVSGCVIVTANGIQSTHYAPDYIMIDAGVEHSVVPVNGPAKWYCCHITNESDETKVDEVLIQKTKHMVKADFKFDVSELVNQIDDNPSLWDRYTMRTALLENSPHREVSDIWLRYRDWSEFDIDNPQYFSDEHISQFYAAYYELPGAQSIISEVMKTMPDHAKLAGCLITKVPAGKQVYPHSDAGAWHSAYYNRKVLILLKSEPWQSFNFGDESHEGEAGDVFFFDNRPVHSVVNNSNTDRISLILAIRDICDE